MQHKFFLTRYNFGVIEIMLQLQEYENENCFQFFTDFLVHYTNCIWRHIHTVNGEQVIEFQKFIKAFFK